MAWPASSEELPGGVENQTDGESGLPNPVAYAAAGGEDPEGEGDHAQRHNDLADAVNRTWTELGVNPSGAQADVAARLAAIGLTLATHTEGLSTAGAAIAAEAVRAEAAEAGKAGLAHTHPQYDPQDGLPGVWQEYPGTTATWTLKRLYLARITTPKARPMKSLRWVNAVVNAAEDKAQAGLYKLVGGNKLELLSSSAVTAVTTNSLGVKSLSFAATVNLEPGTIYYRALGFETLTGTPQWAAILNNNGIYGDILYTGSSTAVSGNRLYMFKEASVSMPAEITSVGGSAPVPWMVPSEL